MSVKIKGVDAVTRKIDKTFKKILDSEQMVNEVGLFLRDRVKQSARRSKPLNDSRSFPKLKKSSISIRTYLASNNSTDIAFNPKRSNTTLTGQLLNAIIYKISGRGKFIIEVEGTIRDPYIINRNGELGPIDSNKEVADDLRSRGFVLFTKKGIESDAKLFNRMNNIVKKFVRRAIKVNFGS